MTSTWRQWLSVKSTNHHWFIWWLVAWPVPSHYLKQWWDIVIGTLGKKFWWNLNRNLHIFIQENAFENVVWKMAAILSRPQSQSLATDMRRLFYSTWPPSFSSHIKKEVFLIGEESDDGHIIKRALYIGIKRLWPQCIKLGGLSRQLGITRCHAWHIVLIRARPTC